MINKPFRHIIFYMEKIFMVKYQRMLRNLTIYFIFRIKTIKILNFINIFMQAFQYENIIKNICKY